jgi:hypothetical protein
LWRDHVTIHCHEDKNSSKDVKSKVIDSMTSFLALGTWFVVVSLLKLAIQNSQEGACLKWPTVLHVGGDFCHIVALQSTLKRIILRQKKTYGNSYISP